MNINTAPTKLEFSNALACFPEANFLQSWQWGETQAALSRTVVRVIITHHDTIVGVWSGVVRDAKRGRYLEVAGGPLVGWDNHEIAVTVLDTLREEGRKHHCVFVRFRPQHTDSPAIDSLLRSYGARLAPMHIAADHTSVLTITPPLDDLLQHMRQQTRYEIRRSAKRDLTITAHSGNALLDEFCTLQADTAARQGFIPPSKQQLAAIMDAFGEQAKIYTVRKHDQTLNMALVLFFGDEATYYEAASTMAARKEPGAYALLWQIIQDAKAAGLTRFNLWGIAPNDNPEHRFAGVTTFKRGFGGDDVTFVPAHDLVRRPLRYQLTRAFELARKKKRGL